jgi:hypothetical protein
VAISGVLVNGSFPADLNNITGPIDVVLHVQPNGHTITDYVVLIDGVQAGQSSTNVVSFDTGEIDVMTDKLRFCNGPHTMAARVFWQGGPPNGVTSAFLNVTFNNSGTCGPVPH